MAVHDFLMGATDRLLAELVANSRISATLMFDVVIEQRRTNQLLARLLHGEVQSFTLTRTGDSAMTPFSPGSVVTITATDVPAGSTLPEGVVPVWTSSDPLAAIALDSTGLIATVTLDPTIVVGASVTFTATATLPDSTTPTGSLALTVVAPPPPEVSSFSLAQSA